MTCTDCGADFHEPVRRGRPSRRCKDCRTADPKARRRPAAAAVQEAAGGPSSLSAGMERAGEIGMGLMLNLATRSLRKAVDEGALLSPDVAAKLIGDYHKLKASNARLRKTPAAPTPAPGNAR